MLTKIKSDSNGFSYRYPAVGLSEGLFESVGFGEI